MRITDVGSGGGPPAGASSSRRPHGLVGRDRALAEAQHALAHRTRLLTVRGPPGVGKTTFGRALARRLEASGAAVVVVALDGRAARAEVLAAIGAGLGLALRTRDERVMLDRVAAALEARAAVLVLDGVDPAAAVVGAVVADLLDGTEAARIVVCAWRALALPAERVMRLEPLATADAVALLEDRVARLAPERRLSRPDAEALVAHAGALPLAVELLAARVAALGAREVLAALERHGLVSDALDRVLDAAWSLLDPSEQEALAALSVLRGAFTPEVAARIAGDHEVVERLCAASLVQSAEDDDGVTLWLLDGVRHHAARRLPAQADAHARHCATFARPPSPRADDRAAWRALQREREDLLAAWAWACQQRDLGAGRQVLQLAVTLEPVLVTQGPATLHRRVLEETLARCGDHADPLTVDVRLALGRFEALRGRHRSGLAHYRAALAAAEGLGDRSRTGWAAALCCFSAGPAGEPELARALGERALEVAREAHDLRLNAMAEQSLGWGALVAEDPRAGESAFRRGLTAARLAQAPRLEGIAWANLGLALLEQGQGGPAGEAFAEARRAFASVDDRFHLARVAVHEAVRAGDEEALRAALDQGVALDDREGELCAREALVMRARAAGDEALAARRLDELRLLVGLAEDVSWPRRLARLTAAPLRDARPARGPALRLSRDGRTLELDGRSLDFSRRGPLRRVLLALVTARLEAPGRALTALEVQAAGWPGEKMLPESGAARVYMAVRRLRALGLEAVLLTRDEGYALDPALECEVW